MRGPCHLGGLRLGRLGLSLGQAVLRFEEAVAGALGQMIWQVCTPQLLPVKVTSSAAEGLKWGMRAQSWSSALAKWEGWHLSARGPGVLPYLPAVCWGGWSNEGQSKGF